MGEAANAPAPPTNVTLRAPEQGIHTDGIVSGRVNRVGGAVYNGGPVVGGPIQLVPIFYGTAWQPNYQATILSFLGTMSSTSYWAVVEQYGDSAGNKPGAVSVAATVYETDYAYGTSLSPENIAQIVQSRGAPVSHHPNTIYLVFTADDVNQVKWPSTAGDQAGAFCKNYLGWHWYGNFTYRDPERPRIVVPFTTEYAWIGSPQYCISQGLGGVISPWEFGPNGTVTDETINAALHEVAESVTDPFGGSGWAPEIGDTCNFIPGPVDVQRVCVGFTCGIIRYEWDLGGGAPYASNQLGYSYNQGRRYLVQTIWDSFQNGCAYGPATLDGP
jgi:hypothetical protein